MFQGLKNMANLMRNASQMQGKMQEAQRLLQELQVQGSAGDGAVTVVANGQQKIVAVRISPSAPLADPQLMAELFQTAANTALDQAKLAAAETMAEVLGTGGMPGMTDALENMGIV